MPDAVEGWGARIVDHMRTRRFLIAAVAAASLGAGLGSSVLPASAQRRTLVVTLQGGKQITVTVDVPAGTPVSQIQIPNVSLPIVSVVEPNPPAATSTQTTQTQTTQTQTQTQTETTPAPPSKPKPPKKPSKGKPSKGTTGKGTKGKGGKKKLTAKQKAAKKKAAKQKRAEALKKAAAKKHAKRTPSGVPTPADPTYSFAQPGAAQIGVPNFFIDRFRIPPFLLSIYQAAGIEYGIPWQVLAGINEIETDYGRNLNVSSAGAVGWMQFLPSTWKRYGVDANGDDRKDPYNPVDAIFGAARYLKAAGGDKDIKKAIFAYNHADWYVQSVLLRAKLIGGLPDGLVGSLTGLTQAHFPVAAKAQYADEQTSTKKIKRGNAAVPVEPSARRKNIQIFAKKGSPVIAVNDGRIVKVGQKPGLGRYVVLQDVYGNTFTYGHLGSVSKYYAVPKEKKISAEQVRQELKLPKADPKPTGPASAGDQTPKLSKAVKKAAKNPSRPARPRVTVHRERLFAHPMRPMARKAGSARQLHTGPKFTTFKDYFTVALGLKRKDVSLKPMKKGSRVIAGTILGRIGQTQPKVAPHLLFSIRPAGKGSPRVDPKPILDGWKLLEATAIYRAAGKNPFFGPDAKNPSIGQVLLMSKEALETRVLADPKIDIYGCGRKDIEGGQIDRRVLATLLYLRLSGLEPTVTSLHCGHSFLTASGNVSEHSSGTAVDIAKINGIPIIGHQGKGSITDITIRRLLLLQGNMKPHQIISLMTYRGTDNTLALPDHNDHIHVGFRPLYGANTKLGKQVRAILKPGQWIKLVDRLNEIPNPSVSVKPSKYAVKVKPHSGD
jgi:murein DD-endopeptidase MepM/ murein hydrolase activator NlpD